MTKRHFLFIALLTLVGIQAFADQIDQKQAVEIAVAFMNQKVEKNPSFRRGKKMKSSEMVISHVISSQAGEPNIYILNTRQKGSGFVIVSGDTQISDVVLGYSDTGEFDYENAPENAKAWVDGYAKGISDLASIRCVTSPRRLPAPLLLPCSTIYLLRPDASLPTKLSADSSVR